MVYSDIKNQLITVGVLLDYRYLKAFILTAQNLSFSKAASILNIAQSAVSRQIKLLEDSIGKELIIRSSKKVLLTNKGLELYTAALNFDKQVDNILDMEDTHPLNIGVLHGILESWLTKIIIEFYKKNRRNLNIFVCDLLELKDGISQGKFDLIFSIENIQTELVSSLYLFDEKFVLISKEEASIKKVPDYRWIVYSENDNIFKLSKDKSKEIITVSSITSIKKLVKNGVGVAVVPDHVISKEDKVQVQNLSNLPESKIYMTCLNYKVVPSYIKEFTELIGK